MAQGYTVFFTYMLWSDSTQTNGYGYSDAIHCNYINKLYLDDIVNREVNIYFNNINDFKFLSNSGGTGYTTHKIYVLVQLINNSTYDDVNDVIPLSNNWKMFNVTNQILGYVSGQTLSALELVTTIFKVSLTTYTLGQDYNLDYLNYPNSLQTDELCFGDEQLFLGNISTDVGAIAYSTDLAITLPLVEFNSSNNETWDGISKVYISEVGIHDDNYNLVAIGKLNNPVSKDGTISRTLNFGLDF